MRPVTERFLRTVTSSHRMTARARVVPAGASGVDPDGTEVPILDGDVLLDATAKVRGTLDLTTAGSWPTTAGDLFAPFGNELYIERGVTYGGGVTEWCGLGYFRLENVEQQQAPRGTIRLGGSDRMAGLDEARLVSPIQFAATALYGAVVEQLVTDVYPGATIEWDDATDTEQLGRTLVARDNRRDFLDELVTGRGKTWAWDHRGVLVIRDVPDPAAAVATIAGGADGVLVQLSRELSRKGTYNAVVATGDAPGEGEPARAVVVDANPSSPTYFDGPFGPVPRFYSSPMLVTDLQAETAARALLRRSLGLPYSVGFGSVPNPALEPLDPVAVLYPGQRTETHVLTELTIPLVPEQQQTAKTREQTLVMIGTRA